MFFWPDSAVEGVSSSSSTKDVGSSSPVTDRKKHRRKKSMNQKGDATIGQADGKRCVFLYAASPQRLKQQSHSDRFDVMLIIKKRNYVTFYFNM